MALDGKMNNESTSLSALSLPSHFTNTDNQDQYKGLHSMNRLNIANLLNAATPIMQVSSEWQNLLEQQAMTQASMPPLMPNPWLNVWMQFQSSQLQPHLQYAALAKTISSAEDPLDLSNKTMNILQKLGMLDVKTDQLLPKNDKNNDDSKVNSARRNYTMEDLTQAVEDIRQGKLGTRRASVVYGIPRSTLRNKIYKLEAEGTVPVKIRRGSGKIGQLKSDNDPSSCKSSSGNSDSSSSSPRPSLYPSSPDSTDSSVEGAVPSSEEAEDKKPESPITAPESPTWIDTLWQNLFKNAPSQFSNELLAVQNLAASVVIPDSKPLKTSIMNGNGGDDWKRSRPKRGQYRKYDKNALDEAVRSVRRGEMSVHRAGSYFGVPHSTLEYKVKERNLMRKKKDTTTPTSTNSYDLSVEDIAPHVTSTISEKQEVAQILTNSSNTSSVFPFIQN